MAKQQVEQPSDGRPVLSDQLVRILLSKTNRDMEGGAGGDPTFTAPRHFREIEGKCLICNYDVRRYVCEFEPYPAPLTMNQQVELKAEMRSHMRERSQIQADGTRGDHAEWKATREGPWPEPGSDDEVITFISGDVKLGKPDFIETRGDRKRALSGGNA